MIKFEDYFSIQIFFIILRETLETAIIISVLLSFINQRSHKQEEESTLSTNNNNNENENENAVHPISISQGRKADMNRKLKFQVWIGAILGLIICFIIGIIFVLIFYFVGQDYWSYTERVWEGLFSILSSIIITIMGIGLLRINKVMKLKWWIKLGDAYNYNGQQDEREEDEEISALTDNDILFDGNNNGEEEDIMNYGGTRSSSESNEIITHNNNNDSSFSFSSSSNSNSNFNSNSNSNSNPGILNNDNEESIPLTASSNFFTPFKNKHQSTAKNSKQLHRQSFSKKYFLAILPLVTTLREGLEAVVFIGGSAMSSSPHSIPLSVICGISMGSIIGYFLYQGGNKLSLQYFLIFSTCFLYIVSAGLMSRGIWFLELEQYVRQCNGLDVSETGSGPGSYDIAKSVWHVNCCNGLTDGWWMVFNAIFGWTNSATYGSVFSYMIYWTMVIIWLKIKLYEERHGILPLVPLKWQLKRIQKRIRLYELRKNHEQEHQGQQQGQQQEEGQQEAS